MFITGERLPIDEERDGVFRLGHAIVRCARGDASRSGRNDPRRHRSTLEDPTTDINVMGGQVIAGEFV